jgi:hypothetical protein
MPTLKETIALTVDDRFYDENFEYGTMILAFPRGRNLRLEVLLQNRLGKPLDVSNADVYLAVGGSLGLPVTQLALYKKLIADNATLGIMHYDFVPSDTSGLQAGAYYAEVLVLGTDGTVKHSTPPFVLALNSSVGT